MKPVTKLGYRSVTLFTLMYQMRRNHCLKPLMLLILLQWSLILCLSISSAFIILVLQSLSQIMVVRGCRTFSRLITLISRLKKIFLLLAHLVLV